MVTQTLFVIHMLHSIPLQAELSTVSQAGGFWLLVGIGLLVTVLILMAGGESSSDSEQRSDDDGKRVVRVRRVRIRRKRRRL